MEPDQVLKVTVSLEGLEKRESFYGRVSKDGRILVPKLISGLLGVEDCSTESGGKVLGVVMSPVGSQA